MHLIPDRTSIDIYSRAVSNSNPFAVFVDIDQSAEAGSYEISIAQLATTLAIALTKSSNQPMLNWAPESSPSQTGIKLPR